MLDHKALATATAMIVREHLDQTLAPIRAENEALRIRVAALEEALRSAPDATAVASAVADAVASLPMPQDGKDAEVDMAAVAALIDESVQRQISQALSPADIAAEVLKGIPALIDDAVSVAVAAVPPAADGQSVTLDDVRPLIDSAVERAFSAVPAPRDGVGMAGALIDRAGELILTLTDGSTRSLGPVVGRDYDPAAMQEAVRAAVAEIPAPKDGEPGQDADPAVIEQMVADAVAAIPPAKDGKDAYPGQALGLFDAEASYRALDVVSFNGCEWRAKVDDPGPLPGDGWMLSAARGKRGDRGEGRPGKDGSSVVAAYVDSKNLTLVLTRDDGAEIKADLFDLAQTIRG